MLPAWYGAGAGLEFAKGERSIELLRRCYRGWPFFRSLIDDIEAMLARADLDLAAHYDRLAPPQLRSYGAQLRDEYERSCALVLEVKESMALLDTDRTLQRGIVLRNPYDRPDALHAGGPAGALARQRPAEPRASRSTAGQRQRYRSRPANHRLATAAAPAGAPSWGGAVAPGWQSI